MANNDFNFSKQNLLDCSKDTLFSSFNKVLKINLSKNSYTILIDDENKSDDEYSSTLTGYIDNFINIGHIHSEDEKEFSESLNLSNIRSFLIKTKKKSSIQIRYRRKVKDEFRWAILEIIAAEDYSKNNETAYLYVKDIHDSVVNAEITTLNILHSLSLDYSSIFCVDFIKDQVMAFRLNDNMKDSFSDMLAKRPDYISVITAYCNKNVAKEYQNKFMQVMNKAYLAEQFCHRNVYTFEYKAFINQEEAYFRIKISNLSKTKKLTKVVVAVIDISHERKLKLNLSSFAHKILVVEEKNNLSLILQSQFDVLQCSNALDAQNMLKMHKNEISLVLIDNANLTFDTNDLLENLCATISSNNIPIILTSKSDALEENTKLMQLGVTDFLTFPCNDKIIINRISSWINLYEKQDLLNYFETDEITGLYAKKSFSRYASIYVNEHKNEQFSILCSDLTAFKIMNAQLGRQRCDDLLKDLASFLCKIIPGYIYGARVYGDVFLFLIKKPESLHALEKALEPLEKWEKDLGTSVRFGIVDYEENLSIFSLFDRAKMALQTIKGVYGARIAEFNEDFNKTLTKNYRLVADRELALQYHHFEIFYQPKQDLKTGKLYGAEALVRWFHPELGKISPDEFIPLFEHSGFIVKLDEYILTQVCKDIARWKSLGLSLVPISVNLSRRDFESDDLTKRIENIVNEYNIEHNLIHFEITESGNTSSPENVINYGKSLIKCGFQIELDDFGTGYSSLSTLGLLSFHYLKIDKSIVDEIKTSSGLAILKTALRLAQVLNVKVIAEGVETDEQKDLLKSLDCDCIQGYLYSKPLPVKEFEEFIIAQERFA